MADTKKRDIITVIITYVFVLAVVFAIGMINEMLLPLPLALRMVLGIVIWWTMLLATIFFMRRDKEGPRDIGFTKEKVHWQILVGILVAIITLSIFIVIPGLLIDGFIGPIGGTNPLQVSLGIVQYLLAVAFVEEVIFRGHLFKKLLDIQGSKWLAIVTSSLLFGFFHIFNWDPIQIVITTLLGVVWCLLRMKMPHCTLLALIIGHALHNALMPVVIIALAGSI